MRNFFKKLFFELGGKPQDVTIIHPESTTTVRWIALIQDSSFTFAEHMKESEQLRAFSSPEAAIAFQEELHQCYETTGRTYMTDVKIETTKNP